MANCLGWFGVRGVDRAQAIAALRATCGVADLEDIPECFRVLDSGEWALVVLSGSESQYAVPAHAVSTWAQALSLRLNVSTISFLMLEGGWNFAIFDNGNEIAGLLDYTLSVRRSLRSSAPSRAPPSSTTLRP